MLASSPVYAIVCPRGGRGQLHLISSSLLRVESRDLTHLVRLGGKCLYLLSPSLAHLVFSVCVKIYLFVLMCVNLCEFIYTMLPVEANPCQISWNWSHKQL